MLTITDEVHVVRKNECTFIICTSEESLIYHKLALSFKNFINRNLDAIFSLCPTEKRSFQLVTCLYSIK